MKPLWGIILLAGASMGLLLAPQHLYGQACADEISMVEGSRQATVEFAETVKKESVADFATMNHQKSAVIKLGLHDSMLGELIDCLSKAAQDTTATKEAAATATAQHDAAVKLQEKVRQQQAAIKNAKDPKEAKALTEKIDLAP